MKTFAHKARLGRWGRVKGTTYFLVSRGPLQLQMSTFLHLVKLIHMILVDREAQSPAPTVVLSISFPLAANRSITKYVQHKKNRTTNSDQFSSTSRLDSTPLTVPTSHHKPLEAPSTLLTGIQRPIATRQSLRRSNRMQLIRLPGIRHRVQFIRRAHRQRQESRRLNSRLQNQATLCSLAINNLAIIRKLVSVFAAVESPGIVRADNEVVE
jgi:hypothetical protein